MHTMGCIFGQSPGESDWTSRAAVLELGFEEGSGHELGKEGKEGHFGGGTPCHVCEGTERQGAS